MKTRLLAFVLIFCASFTTNAQYVTIPDQNFVDWLITYGYGNCMSGNQMDTTCNEVIYETGINLATVGVNDVYGIQFFDDLTYLNCNYNNLTYLPELPRKLQILSCTDNQITSLPPLPDSVVSLYASRNQLISLPQLNSVISQIVVDYNLIQSLPALPPTLVDLDCGNNMLTTLPNLPNALEYLDYSGNNVVGPVNYPNSLLSLSFAYNNIQYPVLLPANLQGLNMSGTQAISLPQLPASLTFLGCYDNPLDTLIGLPNGLQSLFCNDCNLHHIPTLPDSLSILGCEDNFITSFTGNFPPNLRELYCTDNLLDSLPQFPQGFRKLECSNNHVGELLNLPSTTNYLSCYGNDITNITNFPDFLLRLDLRNNFNLKCLPKLNRIQTMLFENTQITCLPNYGDVDAAYPLMYTLPLCDVNNVNNCIIAWNVSGRVFVDSIVNCTYDMPEHRIEGVKIKALNNGVSLQQTVSGNQEGFYALDFTATDTFEIHIDTTDLPFTVSCPVNGILYDTLTLTDSIHLNRNFALRCKTGFDLAAHSVSTAGIFRPANNTVVNIHAGDLANFYNANCAFGISGTVTVTINGPATYVSPASGAITPGNVAGSVLTWNVADFGTADALHDFNIIVQTDTFAQIGQQVCFTGRVTPTVGDNDSTNNTLTHCFPVVNSYDPNDKTAYPAGNIDTAQEWLTYRVRFQNTGNAEAQHIYIMDTLESDLDESTFQLLAYSHQPNVQINENIVRFNFPNINLPDSFSNEPGSHGYVQYKVKLKENLPIGTTIENTAFIYFDFNPPVVTNTATNTIAEIQDTTIIGIKPVAKAFDINIYPNPANNQVRVTAGQAGNTIYMYTAQGKLVATQNMGGTAETLNIAELPGGIYYIEVAGKAGTARKKLVKF